MTTLAADPHAGQPILRAGPRPAGSRLAMVLVHGRGGSAADMLALARGLDLADVAFVAPQAAGNTWYPYSFLAPLEANEPALGSALRAIERVLDSLADDGVGPDRVVLLGFSQGACLALEFAARHARRYAGLVGLSGGLIGPEGTERDYAGMLTGTPVLLGCSDTDPHIPLERVHESARVLRGLGATVDERIYPRMAHTINEDELLAIRDMWGEGGR